MPLTNQQISYFHENGYLMLENFFSMQQTHNMLHEMHRIIGEDCPRRILEKNGAVRSFFAPEWSSDVFMEVVQSEKLVRASMQLLNDDVYVHQSKINSKYAMEGDWWEWHQDYTFWKKDDGMPTSNVVTAMIFLNDINEFNGPLLMVPGSHKFGMIDCDANEVAEQDSWFSTYQKSTTYMSALTADLKYTLETKTVRAWADKRGMVAGKGPAGSVLFFHGNIFHASSNNLSPWDRHTFLVTYNSVHNTLPAMEDPRPEFIANRNFQPILVGV